MKRLRAIAKQAVQDSPLIQKSATGNLNAARALSFGFWPFVRDFEQAIDQRVNSTRLPREPLYAKFGRAETRRTLLKNAQAVRDLEESELTSVFDIAVDALRDMQKEERTHSYHWAADARNLGISQEELDQTEVVDGVRMLIAGAHAENLLDFFGALAATEFIAEELGDTLAATPAYTRLFNRKRAIWMEVHTVPHDEGPSHADIVMDFLRAYSRNETANELEQIVVRSIHLFGAAARDVEASLYRSMATAAE